MKESSFLTFSDKMLFFTSNHLSLRMKVDIASITSSFPHKLFSVPPIRSKNPRGDASLFISSFHLIIFHLQNFVRCHMTAYFMLRDDSTCTNLITVYRWALWKIQLHSNTHPYSVTSLLLLYLMCELAREALIVRYFRYKKKIKKSIPCLKQAVFQCFYCSSLLVPTVLFIFISLWLPKWHDCSKATSYDRNTKDYWHRSFLIFYRAKEYIFYLISGFSVL